MRSRRTSALFGLVLALIVAVSAIYVAAGQSSPPSRSQVTPPPSALSLHLVGVHIIKAEPDRQYVAHHYCQQLQADLIQCAVFDSDRPGARLMDVEYVVPGEVYESLSSEEQEYWHPHDYEVDNGLLRAPELSSDEERELLQMIRTTRGKTWHMWATKEDPYPLHAPDLAWSITQDGQLREDIGRELEAMPR